MHEPGLNAKVAQRCEVCLDKRHDGIPLGHLTEGVFPESLVVMRVIHGLI